MNKFIFHFVFIVLTIFGLFLYKFSGHPRYISNVSPPTPTIEQKPHTFGTPQTTKEEWKKVLTPEQYHILREAGTEPPFSHMDMVNNHQKGTFVTADCGIPVFRSEQKFESGTGWPSFWAPIKDGVVDLKTDTSFGLKRTEVVEKTCGSHLGHVFDDGPEPTGKRYCINAAALVFIPDKE